MGVVVMGRRERLWALGTPTIVLTWVFSPPLAPGEEGYF